MAHGIRSSCVRNHCDGRGRRSSALRRGGGNWYFARVRLVAHAGGPHLGALSILGVALAVFVALEPFALLVIAALLVALGMLLATALVVLRALALLLRLVHGVQDAKVMFRMLEERFCCHPVATAGRIAAELEVFFEELLGGAADADLRPVAVENVVAIKRNSAARMMTDRTARSPTTATTAGTMVAATHALHVHTVAVVLSYCRRAYGGVGHPIWASPGSSLGQPRSIGVDDGTRRFRRV